VNPDSVADVARLIQLAVAPVFLLTAVGTIIGVLSNRLGRVVDRARSIESELAAADAVRAERIHAELHTISVRARLIGRAIALAVLCALLVTVLLIVAFIDAFIEANLSFVLATIFVAALVAFSGSLLVFLREIIIASANLRIGPH